MPKISIIIPVYNVEKYLRQCLDSVVNQTYKNIEIVCVNDASPDNSLTILNEYAQKDSRIIIVDKKENEGLPQARKSGFEKSRGEYIVNIDSDDWVEIDMIEKMINVAVEQNCDMVYCGHFEERESNTNTFVPQIIPENKIKRMKHLIFDFGSAKTVWNKLIKRELYEKIKFPKESNSEDGHISSQLFYYIDIDKIGYCLLPLYHYRYWENSLSKNRKLARKRYEGNKANYEQIIEFCKEKFGDDLSVFEPELSNRINRFKYEFILHKGLNIDFKLLKFEQYPKSNFTKYLLRFFIKKTAKTFIPPKIRAILKHNYARIKAAHKRRQTLKLIPTLEPLALPKEPAYIVSLTSYGKRLKDTAPYAIISLFNQSVRPDRIILWVGRNDREKIPSVMAKLQEKGLDILFCEDVRSYTKLIPSLENFPNDYIITADDDIYYPQNWFEQLITEHKKNPKKIICHRAHGIKVDENHNLLPYNEWDYCAQVIQAERIFPTGVGGILYPPKCFHKDITNKELFMKLAPHADDVWFWAMAVINREYFGDESPYVVIEGGYSRDLDFVAPELEISNDTLNSSNVRNGGNDKQLKAVIEQYPQIKGRIKL